MNAIVCFARYAMKRLARRRVSNRELNTSEAIKARNDFDPWTGAGPDHHGLGPNKLPAHTTYMFQSERPAPREKPWGA
jgi:hypothetical protein